MMEELLAFSGVDRAQMRDVIDIGCGVGGASRFLVRSIRLQFGTPAAVATPLTGVP